MLRFNTEDYHDGYVQHRKTPEKYWIKQRRSAFWYSYSVQSCLQ